MRAYHFIAVYFAAINLITLILMGLDKHRAKRGAFRVPEIWFFSLAVFGGSIGAILGMRVFRHKTRHPSFRFGMPLILIAQIALFAALYASPVEFRFL